MGLGGPCGRIELICGPMFAGKTTALLRCLTAAREAGCVARVFKPARDTRYDAGRVVTHDGDSIEAVALGSAVSLRNVVGGASVSRMVVGIDEVHFFDRAFSAQCAELAARGVRVVAAGVDLDHRGVLFEVMAELIARADEVTRLTAKCSRCGAPATHTERLIASEARIVVGGASEYEPRCAACFEGGIFK